MSLNVQPSIGPGFWATVRLLLANARHRSKGRARRQAELRSQRRASSGDALGAFATLFMVAFFIFIHGMAAHVVQVAVKHAQAKAPERFGHLAVSEEMFSTVRLRDEMYRIDPVSADKEIDQAILEESQRRLKRLGGSFEEHRDFLQNALRTMGPTAFVKLEDPGLRGLASAVPFPRFMGFLALFFWCCMMVFQGEGMELDLQRRRHPMWEWLFSHPAPPSAIFLAEILSPLASNLIYATGPVFIGGLFGIVYGVGSGIAAALLAGIPITIAMACLGKAFETGVMLRLAPRNRGAVLGIMGWMGYAIPLLLIFGSVAMSVVTSAAARWLAPITDHLPWPWLGWCLGARSDGTFSFVAGIAFCWLMAMLITASAVGFCLWGARCGLSADPSMSKSTGPRPSRAFRKGVRAVHRKEWLWLVRDRGAIVQALLIPLTIAATQVFNYRNLIVGQALTWNRLTGIALLFGTYFLWILGPRSLASEGQALWIPLTWPKGMEGLLKAKARLWFFIASGLISTLFVYALLRFPADAWKILLVMAGWGAFGLSIAYKSVTLVSVPSASGEVDPIPWSRRLATFLGMLTFGVGILNEQWPIALMGIVYSWMTAAALWQNFRSRLPFLFDPWSERVPDPPTLMHAMIAISALVEVGSILVGLFMAFDGQEGAAATMAIGYAACATATWLYTDNWLKSHNVMSKDIWCWTDTLAPDRPKPLAWSGDGERSWRFLRCLAIGVGAGVLLAILAHGYTHLLQFIPSASELLRKSQELLTQNPGLKIAYGFMAICVAPFAEEYLFRGLLFRALDREWGGWRAILGSAAFFSVYHRPLAWPPVFLLGATNAWLFKKTGRLAPAVALHLVYNTLVMLMMP